MKADDFPREPERPVTVTFDARGLLLHVHFSDGRIVSVPISEESLARLIAAGTDILTRARTPEFRRELGRALLTTLIERLKG